MTTGCCRHVGRVPKGRQGRDTFAFRSRTSRSFPAQRSGSSPLRSWSRNAKASLLERKDRLRGVDIDPETNLPHIYGHEVDEQEVEDVLRRSGEDRPGREDSRVAIGQTRAGRYIRVIYVPDAEVDSVFVITAYQLKGKALLAYRRRRRRKV